MHALARYRAVPLAMRCSSPSSRARRRSLIIGPPVSVLAPLGEVLVFALRVLAPFVVAVVLASVSGTALSLGATGRSALTVFAVLGAASAFVGSVAARLAWARAPQITPLALADGASRSWSDLAEVWAGPALRTLDTAIVVVLLVSVPLALAIGVWRDARPAGAGMRIYRRLQRAAAVLTRVVVGVMEYAPVATFALAAVAFGAAGRATGRMAAAFATVYGAQLVVALVVVLLVALCGHRAGSWRRPYASSPW
jgi:Na+/H+-dicarboxylate symporter